MKKFYFPFITIFFVFGLFFGFGSLNVYAETKPDTSTPEKLLALAQKAIESNDDRLFQSLITAESAEMLKFVVKRLHSLLRKDSKKTYEVKAMLKLDRDPESMSEEELLEAFLDSGQLTRNMKRQVSAPFGSKFIRTFESGGYTIMVSEGKLPKANDVISRQRYEAVIKKDGRNWKLDMDESDKWHKIPEKDFNTLTDGITSLSFSPDNRLIAFGDYDFPIKLVNAKTLKEVRTFGEESKGATALVFSPDGSRLASIVDGKLMIWQVETGEPEQTVTEGVSAFSFTPDGKTMVTGTSQGELIFWDLLSAKEVYRIKAHSDAIRTITFNDSSRSFATGSADTLVKVWDSMKGKRKVTLSGHEDGVNWVSFSRDGKQIASASRDKTVIVWDITTPSRKHTFNSMNEVNFTAFSPDGTHLVYDGFQYIKVLDLSKRTMIRKIDMLTEYSDVAFVRLSPDGSMLISSSGGPEGEGKGRIKFWRIQ